MESRRLALVASAIAASVYAFSVIIYSAHLPERVATHLDGGSQANGWMTRGQHVGFMLGFGILLPLFIVGATYITRFINPRLLNVPNPDYWRSPEHFPEASAFLLTHSIWLANGLWVWLIGLNYSIVDANKVSPPRLSPTWITSLMVFFFVGLIVWVVQMVRFFNRKMKS